MNHLRKILMNLKNMNIRNMTKSEKNKIFYEKSEEKNEIEPELITKIAEIYDSLLSEKISLD